LQRHFTCRAKWFRKGRSVVDSNCVIGHTTQKQRECNL